MVQTILNALGANIGSLVIAAIVITLLIILWRKGKKDLVKRIIYAMVCRAEQLYGSKTGPVKLAEVWAMIYERLPWLLRVAFPRSELEKYIEEGVQALKKQLESGSMNLLTYNQEVESVIDGKVSKPTE